MKLNERLFELRRRAGLSQEELAAKIGVSRQAVGKWENGTSVPELEKLLTLSELYGVTVGELIGAETPPERQGTALGQTPDAGELEELLRGLGEQQRAAELKARGQRRYLWCALGAAAAAVVIVTAVMGSKIARLNRQISELGGLVVFTQNSLNNSISSIQNTVAGLLEEQDALFTSWDCVQEYDAPMGRIRLRLTAVPKTLEDGMEVRFTVRCGEESQSALGEIREGVCTAELYVPALAKLPDGELIDPLDLLLDDGDTPVDGYAIDCSAYGDWLIPVGREMTLLASVSSGGSADQRELGSIYVGLDQAVPARSAYWYCGGADDDSLSGILTVDGEGDIASARLILCAEDRVLESRELDLSLDKHFSLPKDYLMGGSAAQSGSGVVAVTVRPDGDTGARYWQELTAELTDAGERERILGLLEVTDSQGVTYLGFIFAGRMNDRSGQLSRDNAASLLPVVKI